MGEAVKYLIKGKWMTDFCKMFGLAAVVEGSGVG